MYLLPALCPTHSFEHEEPVHLKIIKHSSAVILLSHTQSQTFMRQTKYSPKRLDKINVICNAVLYDI